MRASEEIRAEIANVDAEIAQLRNEIAAREEEWQAEQAEMQGDPMYRIAASEYVRTGDRSGLESWRQNRLMAEQNLVDKLGALHNEELEYSKAIQVNKSKIRAYEEQLKNTTIGAQERVNIEAAIEELKAQNEQFEAGLESNAYRKEQAQRMYTRKTGKTFPLSKMPKAEPKEEPKEEPKAESHKADDDSKVSDKAEFVSKAAEWATKNLSNKSLTAEDVLRKATELSAEMKAKGLSEDDIADVLNKLSTVKTTYTDIKRFKDESGYQDAYNKLTESPTNDSKTVEAAFKDALESDLFKSLSAKEQQEIYNEISQLKKGTTAAKVANANEGTAVGNAAEWNKMKDSVVKDIEASISQIKQNNYTDGQKMAADAWAKVSSNNPAVKALKAMGYEYKSTSQQWIKNGGKR